MKIAKKYTEFFDSTSSTKASKQIKYYVEGLNVSSVEQKKLYSKFYNQYYKDLNPEAYNQRHRKYRSKNSEKIANYNKEYMETYYQENRETIIKNVRRNKEKKENK